MLLHYVWFSSRNLRWIVTTFVAAIVVVCLVLPSYRIHHRHHSGRLTSFKRQIESSPSYKIILYWTKYFSWNDFGVGAGRTPFLKAQCDDGRTAACVTTTDRSLLNHSDAILFHARDLDPDDLPPPGWRRPHQNYIFFNYESPVHTDLAMLRTHFSNYFNRTMTYRRNSDIVSLQPYGRIKCAEASPPGCVPFPRSAGQPDRDASGPAVPVRAADLTWKNRTAAWFVSNCQTNSRRELLVRNLSHHIPVDIFGNCEGGSKCSHKDDCDDMLSKHYRFYLSFENSMCPDYVTEKLYRALEHDTVPVVFGGADYSSYLPPGSYVDARDFVSVQHLASHLKKLMLDDQLYLSHFRWRGSYIVDPAPMDGWCQLCRLLSDTNAQEKTYADIAAWWAGSLTNESCFPPPPTLVSLEEEPVSMAADYVSKIVSKLRTMVF